MTQEVCIGEQKIVLDSEKIYSGLKPSSDAEKLVRKAIGLPVTKQLVYYRNKSAADSIVNVIAFQLVEMYEITERWYTVRVILEDNSEQLIHSDYLAEMQKPSFISDMAVLPD